MKKFKFWCKGTSTNPNFNKAGWWTFNNIILRKYYGGMDIFESPDFEVCQWTGLVDKDGREIYEGDIFKGFHCPFKGAIIPYRPVEFHNGTFFVKIKGSEHPMYLHRFLENDYGDAILPEVIGNIFQNPELLQN